MLNRKNLDSHCAPMILQDSRPKLELPWKLLHQLFLQVEGRVRHHAVKLRAEPVVHPPHRGQVMATIEEDSTDDCFKHIAKDFGNLNQVQLEELFLIKEAQVMIDISGVVIPPSVLQVSKNLPVHSWGAVQDVLVQGDVGQERGEEVVVDQGGPDVGDPPWVGVSVLAVDVAGHQVVEHCVAEQFQPLISFCNPVVAMIVIIATVTHMSYMRRPRLRQLIWHPPV